MQEEQSVEEFEDSSRELTRLNLFVGRISALLNPVTYVLINIATIILIDRAGIQVNMGNMQQGEVVALYNYMLQIIVELIKLASLIITLNKSMACADRVAGILAVKSSMTYVNDEMRQKRKSRIIHLQLNLIMSHLLMRAREHRVLRISVSGDAGRNDWYYRRNRKW